MSKISSFIKKIPVFMLLAAFSIAVEAGEANNLKISITDQGFVPNEMSLPAGKKIQLIVQNNRQLPSEFESYPLNREKIVPAGKQVRIWIGPLSPGKYAFFDDLNPGFKGHIIVQKDAKGRIHVK
jgi:iron uptake system EfeUOB component EfeO/EfeM